MSSFTFVLLCVQACLIQYAMSCPPGISYSAIRAPCANSLAPSAFTGAYNTVNALNSGISGDGLGNARVEGMVDVTGSTKVSGIVPVAGKVAFGGDVDAKGSVTIAGQCCGC